MYTCSYVIYSTMNVKINEFSSKRLTLLSGCDGGNGVYSFFKLFFLGSLRLARFLWRNFGRKRSQLCIRRSGSLDSSRLIISVWWPQPSENVEWGGGGGGVKVIQMWKFGDVVQSCHLPLSILLTWLSILSHFWICTVSWDGLNLKHLSTSPNTESQPYKLNSL